MARANLKIDESVLSAWAEANESGLLAAIGLVLQNETVTTTPEKLIRHEAGSSFWTKLVEEISNATTTTQQPAFASPGGTTTSRITPMMWLVCTDPAAKQDARWVLISYTPDGVHPRAKMLYASARDDIKRTLGGNRFESDYHTIDISEITAEAFAAWRARDRHDAMTSAGKVTIYIICDTILIM
jgi:hypothetical protein